MTEQMLWLAEGDPVRMQEYKKMPVVEYYQILDAKIAETKKKMKAK